MDTAKIIKHLSDKKVEKYSCLDILFKNYCDGELLALLSKYKFTSIEIFPKVSKRGNSLEICLTYQNIAANIVFIETELEYSIYPLYASADKVQNETFELICDSGFVFEEFINAIFEKMTSHRELKTIAEKTKKKNKYKILAGICLAIPGVFFGSMVVLVKGFKLTIQLNFWWLLFFVIIPLILHSYLNNKKT